MLGVPIVERFIHQFLTLYFQVLCGNVNALETCLANHQVLKPKGEPTLEEKAVTGFLHLFAKRTKPDNGHPRLDKRLTVQILSWMANQVKLDLTFGGAQTFHT